MCPGIALMRRLEICPAVVARENLNCMTAVKKQEENAVSLFFVFFWDLLRGVFVLSGYWRSKKYRSGDCEK